MKYFGPLKKFTWNVSESCFMVSGPSGLPQGSVRKKKEPEEEVAVSLQQQEAEGL